MNNYTLITAAYFILLFWIAMMATKHIGKAYKYISAANIYVLSLAVYCTAWTYFGSVGNAANTGIGFLPVYLGPTLIMPFAAFLWVRMIRVCTQQQITNLSDLLSARYGNSVSLGALVAICYTVGIIPYISIQLKAVSTCMQFVSAQSTNTGAWVNTLNLYSTIAISVFAMIYGTRQAGGNEKHTGLIFTVAVESVIKLVAFFILGAWVCFGVFDNPMALFDQFVAKRASGFISPLKIQSLQPLSWFLMIFVAGLAFITLPRQFQVAVTENNDESHVSASIWKFPLYLFLINIFVLPIALGGRLTFDSQADPDTYLLLFAQKSGSAILMTLIYLGGLSAAVGMIVVETIALSNMISNSIAIPSWVWFSKKANKLPLALGKGVVWLRRMGILLILMFAYFFETLIAEKLALSSIGYISFVAVSQMAPALIGGMFWKKGTKIGAFSSILVGFFVWFYTLIMPNFASRSRFIDEIVQNGPWDLLILQPTHILLLPGLDGLGNGIFWSLLINILTFIGVSLFTKQSASEALQAEAFVNVGKTVRPGERQLIRKGNASLATLRGLLETFLQPKRTETILRNYAQRNNISLDDENKATDPKLIVFTERVLSGILGAAASRMLISSISSQERIAFTEVMDVAKEQQQVLNLNRELKRKTTELKKISDELHNAYEQLKIIDEQKDEFLTTVTHELRTPLTSIRALGEVLLDHDDIIDPPQRIKYLGTIVQESERMTRLITQILTIERFDSGRYQLQYSNFDLGHLLNELKEAVQPLLDEKNIVFETSIPDSMLVLRSDRDLILQVLYNLLTNAIKYAKQQVSLHIAHDLQIIKISIGDDGPGIAKEESLTIFDKFYQIKNKKLLKPEGSGMGLAISKRILDMHEYSIHFEANKPNGALFIITIEQK
jgi:Na+/proline symporter/nitrogen-specific signal transduction histidine kinase